MQSRGHKLRKEAGDQEEPTGAPTDEVTPSRRRLCCAGCGHTITSTSDRMEVTGRHRHTCVNPAGIVYRIGCFARAPGMLREGPWIAEHSWFAGYAWQIGLCGGCSGHLGWSFRGEGRAPFWGLVVDRLEERED